MADDRRLIEEWLPIAEIGVESLRERTPMTPFPAPNRLHVWWARRPLVASRASILGCLLPADADRLKFLHMLGIHGDPVKARKRLDVAKRTKENLGPNPYGYKRAFQWSPSDSDRQWFRDEAIHGPKYCVLDPTAGGGSIPLESLRLGLRTEANDLNPVARLILDATIELPTRFGSLLSHEFGNLTKEFLLRAEPKYQGVFPAEPQGVQVLGYLYARTIECPYCSGLVPLSPSWKLSSDGTGVRLRPQTKGKRICQFEIVKTAAEHSEGTVSDGDSLCPYPDCHRVIDSAAVIKPLAQAGQMGEQLFTVVYKQREVTGHKKNGEDKVKWVRGYRAPRPEDDNRAAIRARLAEKMPEWEALDYVPNELLPLDTESWSHGNTPAQYGAKSFKDLFSDRQFLCHGIAVEIYRDMVEQDRTSGRLTDLRKAVYIYLAIALDRLRDYNSRMTRWITQREVMANTFDRHDFAMKWSYVEMAPLVVGLGFKWTFEQTADCIGELCNLINPEEVQKNDHPLMASLGEKGAFSPAPVRITCKSADSLDHIEDDSVDVVVMDPPYYDNVMYAELSDFFYVWLKRTAGYVVPELFVRALTDKEHEAIANLAKFKGEKGARERAGRDYQQRMAAIFAECRRVLKPNGIMTLMFTHKATGAWDALTKGLMEAGFIITASWPVNTESGGSLHIKDKAAANSTILLVCRPRAEVLVGAEVAYWEEVEPLVKEAVRKRIEEFQKAGIRRVDLYLACFGPALQEFSEHWPLRRGTPRPKPEALKRRRQAELFEEEWDPFAVTPEDALDAARREVKNWRLQQLTHLKGRADLDPLTSFYVLAWDTFGAPKFDFGEALTLGRAIGVDIDKEIIGHIAEKKGSEVLMWDSARRAAKGALGAADGSTSWLDALHHAAYAARSRNLQAASELLEKAGVREQGGFYSALEALLEVLPVSTHFSGIELEGDVRDFASDFEALENLRRLSFAEDVDEPEQLKLWKEETQGE
jgi:adenine-specific DNA methylase